MSTPAADRDLAKITPVAWLLSLPVRFYRRCISPMKPRTCRFHPTCSEYALEALRIHGPLRGSWLSLRRLLRCHPYCEPGHDPVPPKSDRKGPLLEHRR